MAFVWQAQVLARGKLTLPSPEHLKSFLVPFVIDYDGQRFGKYPLGWPVLLSFGIRLGIRDLVNPLLAGMIVWLTYLLGKRIWNEVVGILAAILTLTSPFFLLNTGTLLSHPFCLVLSIALALFWIDNFWTRNKPCWFVSVSIGLVLGTFAITRPLSALGAALPFTIHSLILLWRGDSRIRKHILTVGATAFLLCSLQLAWQAAASGDPFKNLYTLWWEYDKVGFGEGFGRFNHSLDLAINNTLLGLKAGASDLFGWGTISWLFLPLGVWASRRKRQAWLVSSVFPAIVVLYSAYWISGVLFGPRYYFEGLYSLTLLSAAGIAWLGGWLAEGIKKIPLTKVRPLIITAWLGFLLAANLAFYLPIRLQGIYALYGIQRSMLDPFLTEDVQSLSPALIIVHPDWWTKYGGLLELQDAYLDQPIIFAITRNRINDAALVESIIETDRAVYYYYPDDPFKIYSSPRPSP